MTMWNDDNRGTWMHDGSGWTLMLILVLVLAIAVAVLVALLLRPTHPMAPPANPAPSRPPEYEAHQILRRRFATGEIDEEEFRRRRAALADDTH